MKLLERMQDALEQKVTSAGHDETALQQSRFWMKTVLWSMMGTTAFAIGWLAIAKTEEIVVAKGKLEPIGAVKEVQMPIGGIAKRILVKDGDQVKAGQLVMQLDTETSEQKKLSLSQAQVLKQKQLQAKREEVRLKQLELQRYLQLNREEEEKLKKTLDLDKEIEARLAVLSKEGATGELQYLQQRNKVQEGEGQLMQTSRAC
jgi:hemolysin D